MALESEQHSPFSVATKVTGSKEPTYRCNRRELDPWVGKIPWRRKWQPTLVFLPGKSRGRRSLEGCNSWGHKESVTPLKYCLLLNRYLKERCSVFGLQCLYP